MSDPSSIVWPDWARPPHSGRLDHGVVRPSDVDFPGRRWRSCGIFPASSGYSLDYKLFTQHFVLKLREIIRVNRIAIFLEPPPTSSMTRDRQAKPVCRASPPSGFRWIFATVLSSPAMPVSANAFPRQPRPAGRTGGRAVFRWARARKSNASSRSSAAISPSPSPTVNAPSVSPSWVTGSPGNEFTDEELQLLFLLMEELGLAIKNSWLHHQFSASHKLFSDVLASMSSGSMVVGPDLTILHANRAMLQFRAGRPASRAKPLEFADLQSALATPIYDVVEKGRQALAVLLSRTARRTRAYFGSTIIPFRNGDNRLPQSVMVVVEDFTQIEAAKRYDIESSKTKLISLIAKALRPRDQEFPGPADHPSAATRPGIRERRLPPIAQERARDGNRTHPAVSPTRCSFWPSRAWPWTK